MDLLFPDLVGLGGPIAVLRPGVTVTRETRTIPSSPAVGKIRKGFATANRTNASTPAWTIADSAMPGRMLFPGRRPAAAGPLRSAGPDMARPISAG